MSLQWENPNTVLSIIKDLIVILIYIIAAIYSMPVACLPLHETAIWFCFYGFEKVWKARVSPRIKFMISPK